MQSLSVRYFDETRAGRIISRADRDVDALEPLLIQAPPELLSAVLRCVTAGVALWWIAPALLAALSLVVPLLLLSAWLFKVISQRNWARVAEARAAFTAHLVESVAGVRSLQQTVTEADNGRTYSDLLWHFNRTLVRGNIRASWFLPLTQVLNAIGMALLLYQGATGIAEGSITVGQLAQSLFYVNLFWARCKSSMICLTAIPRARRLPSASFYCSTQSPKLTIRPRPARLYGPVPCASRTCSSVTTPRQRSR